MQAAAADMAKVARRLNEEHFDALSTYLGLDADVLRSMNAELAALASGHGELPQRERIVKHPASSLLMQDVFVRLHGFLFEQHFLPLSKWGRERAPMQDAGAAASAAASQDPRQFHKVVLQRIGMSSFLKLAARHVPADSRCLGWDDTEYTLQVPGCDIRSTWTFQYTGGPLRFSPAERRISGDMSLLASPPGASSAARPHHPTFDAIICGMVFEHVNEPAATAERLFGLLRPGGTLIWYAPFLTQYHSAPSDYFRYTHMGAEHVLRRAGFRRLLIRTVGSDAISSGWLLGFGAGDFSPEQLSTTSLLRTLATNRSKVGEPRNTLYIATAIIARRPVDKVKEARNAKNDQPQTRHRRAHLSQR